MTTDARRFLSILALPLTLGCGGAQPDADGGAPRDVGSSRDGFATDGLVPPEDICRSASSLDIFDDHGRLDPARYRALALAFASAEAVDYRFGSDATAYHPTPEDFPTVYKPDDHEFRHPPDHPSSTYQIGGPWELDPGGYNSSAGQVLFVPDAPADLGVFGVAFLDVSQNVVSERPERPWYYPADPRDVGLTYESSLAMHGGTLGRPVALARARTTDEWTQDAIVAFDDGFLMSTGTHSSGGNSNVSAQLPAGLVPTAIALTTNNELALVTVWDTIHLRGGLAVISLAGPATPGFWGDWNQLYPGLHSYGLFGFMKVLGVVELPGMVAPIAVSAAADIRWPMIGAPDPSELDLSDPATRARFASGDLRERYARAGYAVVLSRSERRVAFVDLQPLFQSIVDGYFTTAERFAATRRMGQGAGEWPPTFEEAPDARPIVIATRDFEGCPSAVATSVNVFRPYNFVGGDPDHLAYVPETYTSDVLVGTEDGTVHVFSVTGLRDERAASDAGITEVRQVPVGRNPTSIEPLGLSYHADDHPVDIMVVSRGDRRVELFHGDPDSGAFTPWKTLRDSRLIDPVTVHDVTCAGNLVPLIAVSDYGGRQLLNYRYDTIHMPFYGDQTFGVGPDGMSEFECGGFYPLPGGALFSSSTNEP